MTALFCNSFIKAKVEGVLEENKSEKKEENKTSIFNASVPDMIEKVLGERTTTPTSVFVIAILTLAMYCWSTI